MKKALATCWLLLSAAQAHAGWIGGVDIADTNVGADGTAFLGLTTPPPNSCNFWAWHFRFDATTSGGKSLLALVLTAKTANKKVNVWYTDSTAPGTNQTNGCNGNSIGVLTGLSIP